MAKKANRICKVCGDEYYYCPNCSGNRLPSWYVAFDREDCKSLFNTCVQYNLGNIDADAAKAKLGGIDLKRNYVADIKATLEKIEKEATKKAKKDVVKED